MLFLRARGVRGKLSERGDLAVALPWAGSDFPAEARADDIVLAAVALPGMRCADPVVSEHSDGELAGAARALRELPDNDSGALSAGGTGDSGAVYGIFPGVFCGTLA